MLYQENKETETETETKETTVPKNSPENHANSTTKCVMKLLPTLPDDSPAVCLEAAPGFFSDKIIGTAYAWYRKFFAAFDTTISLFNAKKLNELPQNLLKTKHPKKFTFLENSLNHWTLDNLSPNRERAQARSQLNLSLSNVQSNQQIFNESKLRGYFFEQLQDAKELNKSSQDVPEANRPKNFIFFGRKSNQQIHNELKSRGYFSNNEPLRKESFRRVKSDNRGKYRLFVNLSPINEKAPNIFLLPQVESQEERINILSS